MGSPYSHASLVGSLGGAPSVRGQELHLSDALEAPSVPFGFRGQAAGEVGAISSVTEVGTRPVKKMRCRLRLKRKLT